MIGKTHELCKRNQDDARFMDKKQQKIVALVLLSYLVTAMNAAVIITSLPKMAAELQLDLSTLSWVQNIYVLAWGSFMLMGGRMSDVLGRQFTMITSLLLFGGGTLWAGVSASAFSLIAARLAQGLGAAILAPTSLALIMDYFEGSERVRVISWYSSISGLGMCVGLILGGMLTESYSWRWGFYSYLPLIGWMIYLSQSTLCRQYSSKKSFAGLDVKGTLLSALGIFSFIYAINGSAHPWAFGVLALLLLTLFIMVEKHVLYPIMPLRLFDKVRSRAHGARILFAGAMMGYYFFISEYLQEVLSFTALEVGWAFLPLTLSTFVAAILVPAAVERYDNKPTLTMGMILMLLGFYWMMQLSQQSDYLLDIALPMLLLGVGQGFVMSPLTNLAIIGVDNTDAGAASGLVNATHQIGCSLGLSIMVNSSAHFTQLADICRQAMRCGFAFMVIAFLLIWASKQNVHLIRKI